ncbi:hypothetical protein SELMODRAFT_415158 [Selaginella moellendorffii]|uniref:Uncharacterized protein n=1 Tax=Selaginella moellendorffii TaxID=88036 RepID=D8RV75_SELML|nr:hypothetical protein SELMODRAFT_415158 [Selaginella moellendorffii]
MASDTEEAVRSHEDDGHCQGDLGGWRRRPRSKYLCWTSRSDRHEQRIQLQGIYRKQTETCALIAKALAYIVVKRPFPVVEHLAFPGNGRPNFPVVLQWLVHPSSLTFFKLETAEKLQTPVKTSAWESASSPSDHTCSFELSNPWLSAEKV